MIVEIAVKIASVIIVAAWIYGIIRLIYLAIRWFADIFTDGNLKSVLVALWFIGCLIAGIAMGNYDWVYDYFE
jgi:lysophospholipid acyltransferase (LPLAT)-like uncharacterized protein